MPWLVSPLRSLHSVFLYGGPRNALRKTITKADTIVKSGVVSAFDLENCYIFTFPTLQLAKLWYNGKAT